MAQQTKDQTIYILVFAGHLASVANSAIVV